MNSESAVQALPASPIGRLARPNEVSVIDLAPLPGCVDAATPPQFASMVAGDALLFLHSRILPSFQKEDA